MKPLITIKLYDNNNDVIAKLTTKTLKDVLQVLSDVEFATGTVRVEYEDGLWNEANFLDRKQARLLLLVFREKSLLDYIYNGGL
jgi:hypothetical protein